MFSRRLQDLVPLSDLANRNPSAPFVVRTRNHDEPTKGQSTWQADESTSLLINHPSARRLTPKFIFLRHIFFSHSQFTFLLHTFFPHHTLEIHLPLPHLLPPLATGNSPSSTRHSPVTRLRQLTFHRHTFFPHQTPAIHHPSLYPSHCRQSHSAMDGATISVTPSTSYPLPYASHAS